MMAEIHLAKAGASRFENEAPKYPPRQSRVHTTDLYTVVHTTLHKN